MLTVRAESSGRKSFNWRSDGGSASAGDQTAAGSLSLRSRRLTLGRGRVGNPIKEFKRSKAKDEL